MGRAGWLRLHRWAGLGLAGFLSVAGATGCLLAFLAELERAANPEYRVADPPGAGVDPLALRAEVLRRMPEARVDDLPLHREPGEALHLWIEVPGPNGEPVATALVLDPHTGAELSRRTTDVWPVTRKNLMGLVYRLHYSLALGDLGLWLFGVAALVWTLDCFVGAVLTLPMAPRRPGGTGPPAPRRGWWRRWGRSWRVPWPGPPWRLTFDLHRASGLWLFGLLLVFAWSGVHFNLGDQVYRPIMGALLDLRDPIDDLPASATDGPVMDWPQALRRGQELMAAQATAAGFTVRRAQQLRYDRERGRFEYAVLSNRDVSSRWGATRLAFDARDGRLAALSLPSGQASGRTFTNWIVALHTAKVGGLAMQVLDCATGLAVVWLSSSGVWLWWRGRARRRALAARALAPTGPATP